MDIQKDLYLVLNLGLKSIRGIVFDCKGIVIANKSLPVNTYIKGEQVEQNPDEWWDKAKDILNDITKNEIISRHIRGLTVTSSASCLVSVDVSGNKLFNAIMVSDKRARDEAAYISKLKEFKNVKNKLGLGMSAYFMLPKILWLKNNKPEVFRKTYKFLSPNDYLIGKLTGLYVTDTFNAQKYHYDYFHKRYPLELLKRLEIDIEKLPIVYSPGHVCSNIKKDIATSLNLDDNTKVILSTYDAICAFLGSGPDRDGVACDISGTVTSVRTYTNKNIDNKLENIFLAPLKKHNINIVGVSNNLGGGLIEWIKQAFYKGEDNPYELMEKEASESNLGANGLIFLPYLLGERAPVWDDDVRGAFWGIERTHTRKDFVRAVFESTAFITKDLVSAIENEGIKIKKIRVSGGLSRINLISQIKAEVLGKDVEVVDNFETTSLGGLVLLLSSLNIYNTLQEAIANIVDIGIIYKSNKSNYYSYKKLFKLYKKLYNNTKNLCRERKKIIEEIYLEKIESIENL